MIRTLRGRFAAFLAACVAVVIVTSGCSASGLNDTTPTPTASGTQGMGTPSPTTPSPEPTSPAPTVSDEPEAPKDPHEVLVDHPEAEMVDGELELVPLVGDVPIPGLGIDGDEKSCRVEGYDTNQVILTSFGKTVVFNGRDNRGDQVIETKKDPGGLLVKISPNESIYGGWFNGQEAFLIPFDVEVEAGPFIEAVYFPAKDADGETVFGEATSITLCALGEELQ